MGFLSSVSSGFKSVGKAFSSAGSSVRNAVSNFGNNIGSAANSAFKGVTSLGNKFGDGLYNMANSIPGVNTDKIVEVGKTGAMLTLANAPAIIGAVATGNVMAGVEAGLNIVGGTMTLTDRSGDFNPAYAYKKAGFPSQMSYELAMSNGYSDYGEWVKFCKAKGVDPNTGKVVAAPEPVEVIPRDNAKNISVDSVGNLSVESPVLSVSASASGGGSSGGDSGASKLIALAVGAKMLGVI